MKILITGGTGFIGSHLTAALARRRAYKIVVLGQAKRFKHADGLPADWQRHVDLCVGDINDFGLLQGLVGDVDVIFHKVASVGIVASGQSTRQYVQANIGGTACLMEALQKTPHHVKRVVLDSSIAVYGEGNYHCQECGTVRPESRFRIDTAPSHGTVSWDPLCPRCHGNIIPALTPENVERKGESVYAITKKAQEDLVVATCKRLGIALSLMRYSSIYGPGQSEANYCAELMRLLTARRQPLINEDGFQTRDYISIADVIAANLLVLDDGDDGVSEFNVVSGEQTSVLEFVTNVSRAVSAVLGTPFIAPVVTGGFNPADVRHCLADGTRLRSTLGFQCQMRLEDGIDGMARQLATDLRVHASSM